MKITTDDIVGALRKAAYYEAREAELHFRAVLRAEMKRRRSAKGRQRGPRPAQTRPLPARPRPG